MPTTDIGQLPYPAPSDVPDVPADMQELAEATAGYIRRFVRKTSNQVINNNATLRNDDELVVALPVGVWSIVAQTAYGCPNTAADVQQAWTFSGTASMRSRSCLGADTGATSTTAHSMVFRRLASLATVAAYGVPGSTSQCVREDLLLEVTVAGQLRLQWAQNTATVADTTASSQGYLLAEKVAS